jgi:hypothetical protein
MYFSAKGIRISIRDLNGFVNVLEDAFIRNEVLSGLIGRLANYDIRRMRLLAQRIITSPTFQVEDLVRIFVDTRRNAFDMRRGVRALILGDYDRHVYQSDEFIQNLFWTEGSWPTSPLLNLSILVMLESIRASANRDLIRSYITLANLISLFEPCGLDGGDVRRTVEQLMQRGLIEPFDPNNDSLSEGTQIGITQSGLAHMEMALSDSVYLEQMALTTGYRYVGVRDEIADAARDMGRPSNRDLLRAKFKDYLLREDVGKFIIPKLDNIYREMDRLRIQFSNIR